MLPLPYNCRDKPLLTKPKPEAAKANIPKVETGSGKFFGGIVIGLAKKCHLCKHIDITIDVTCNVSTLICCGWKLDRVKT